MTESEVSRNQIQKSRRQDRDNRNGDLSLDLDLSTTALTPNIQCISLYCLYYTVLYTVTGLSDTKWINLNVVHISG